MSGSDTKDRLTGLAEEQSIGVINARIKAILESLDFVNQEHQTGNIG